MLEGVKRRRKRITFFNPPSVGKQRIELPIKGVVQRDGCLGLRGLFSLFKTQKKTRLALGQTGSDYLVIFLFVLFDREPEESLASG